MEDPNNGIEMMRKIVTITHRKKNCNKRQIDAFETSNYAYEMEIEK